jgi:hypothetical protein
MMRRGTLTALVLAVAAQTAHANLFDEARAEALAHSRSESNMRMLNVYSDDPANASNRLNLSNTFNFTQPAPNTNATQAGYTLPAEKQPWGWSWFPFYQCSQVYWRPTQVGLSGQYQGQGIPMSALEKLDSVAHNRGHNEPFSAGFEASDARPWIAQSKGLPAGHNLTLAVAEAGGQTTVPWQQQGQSQGNIDISWWGHCNGWAAASVSFPESQLAAKYVQLAKQELRFLNREFFNQPGQDRGFRGGGGLIGMYQQVPAQQIYMFTEDFKSILTEFGMQLRPTPAFSSGRRYEAPSADVEEHFFERRSDGSVIIPTDATMLWIALYFDGQVVGGWQIPRGYPEAQLQQWRVQIEQYYRYYYPGRQIYTMATARYTNLPMAPTEDQLRDLPALVRKTFLDVDPLEFHQKASQAFSGSGGRQHALIVEKEAGVQVWNFPMKAYQYSFSGMSEVAYNANASFQRGSSTDPSALFNLTKLDRNRLPRRGNQPVLRYRVGSMRVTLQEVSQPKDENYRFLVFYGEGDQSIGSSWAAESLTKHPDFVWYPDLDNPGVPSAGNPYVRADDLRSMLPGLPIR